MSRLWLMYILVIISCISLYSSKYTQFTTEVNCKMKGRVCLYSIPFYKDKDKDSLFPNGLLIQLILQYKFLEIPIDISSDKIWYKSQPNTSNVLYNKCNPTVSDLELQEGSMYFSGGISFTDVTFFTTYQSNPNTDSCLQPASFGLAKESEDIKYSIMELLHSQELPKMFSLHMNRNDFGNSGMLYLGDSLSDKRGYRLKSIKAKTVSVDKYWAININNVFISIEKPNHSMTLTYRIVDEPAIFDTIEEFILVPPQFIGYLNNVLFNDLIQTNQCKAINENGFLKYFCTEHIVSLYQPSISFVINKQIFEIPSSVLFINQPYVLNEYNMLCIIVQSDHVKYITFGNLVLNSFDEIVFDYKKEEIILILYNNTEEITLNGEYKHYSSYESNIHIQTDLFIPKHHSLFILIIALSLIGITITGIQTYKVKKNEWNIQ